MTEISAIDFEARCLALLDEVAQGGGELIVTKRGRPVARVVPVDQTGSLRGSVTYNVGDVDLIGPSDVDWASAGRSPGP